MKERRKEQHNWETIDKEYYHQITAQLKQRCTKCNAERIVTLGGWPMVAWSRPEKITKWCETKRSSEK